MLEQENIQTFICSICEKERRLDGENARRRVSYIETGDPEDERPVCFNCIKRMVRGMSNA
jgi:hypothetical protein